MIGGIIAIGVAVWFYQTAARMETEEPLKWAAIGAGVYYLTVFLWTWFNKTAFMEGIHHTSLAVGVLIHSLGIALGLLAAWLVRRHCLLRVRPGKNP